MLNAIVFGGDLSSFKVYVCDKEEDCLHPRKITYPWKKEDSMYAKVMNIMQSLEDKVLKENAGQNVDLDAKEKDLLSRSSIPILNLISLHAGLKGQGAKHRISEYAEVVAFDYTIGYLDDLVDFVYKTLSNLEHAQIEGDTIKDFKEEIRSIRKGLFYERSNAMNRLHTISAVKQTTKQIENQVFAMFADYRDVNELSGEK